MAKIIFILWGEDKTIKTSLGLSFPKPIKHMEFDIGGFDRANRNIHKPAYTDSNGILVPEHSLPVRDWVNQGLITSDQYIVPFQIQLDRATGSQPKIVVGMKELFYSFASDYIKHLDDPNIATIMVDTGTLLYDITCQGYVQELQEKQMPLTAGGMGKDGKALRTQLQPQEYREPYIRMRGFIYQAKAKKKNLVMTHHATDEYGLVNVGQGILEQGKTGKRVLHGWGQLGDAADVVVKTTWNKTTSRPEAFIELAEVKEIEGMTIDSPTFEKFDRMIQMFRG